MVVRLVCGRSSENEKEAEDQEIPCTRQRIAICTF